MQIGITNHRETTAWNFFYNIPDVTNLSPAEEQQEMWEVYIPENTDGEYDSERPGDGVVGMAVVDTIPTLTFISRIAVNPGFRTNGIASALLSEIHSTHGPVACRVKQRNDAGNALVQSHGFSEVDCRFDTLNRYELQNSNPD